MTLEKGTMSDAKVLFEITKHLNTGLRRFPVGTVEPLASIPTKASAMLDTPSRISPTSILKRSSLLYNKQLPTDEELPPSKPIWPVVQRSIRVIRY